MSRINEKMGLAAQTTTRKATHARSLVSGAQCPACRGRHVVENIVNGELKRLCGFCGAIWIPTPTE